MGRRLFLYALFCFTPVFVWAVPNAFPGTEFDVLSVLQADTDGIVQFVLHGAGGSTNFTTHDSSLGEDYWPALILTYSD